MLKKIINCSKSFSHTTNSSKNLTILTHSKSISDILNNLPEINNPTDLNILSRISMDISPGDFLNDNDIKNTSDIIFNEIKEFNSLDHIRYYNVKYFRTKIMTNIYRKLYYSGLLMNNLKFDFVGLKSCMKKLDILGYNNKGIIKFLSYDEDAKHRLLLRSAVRDNDIDLVDSLTKYDIINTNDSYPLRYASTYGYLPMVKLLINKGANLNALHEHALRNASFFGHIEIVKLLVENGANVSANNMESICNAASNGHSEILEYLLTKVDIPHDDICYKESICNAAMYGHKEIVSLLMDKKKRKKKRKKKEKKKKKKKKKKFNILRIL